MSIPWVDVKLLHFVATWAEPICGPHRAQVEAAAAELKATVVEVDIDQANELVRDYHVGNVPAVAIAGHPDSTLIGARSASDLVSLLRPVVS